VHFEAGEYQGIGAIFDFWKRVMALSNGGMRLDVLDVLANDRETYAYINIGSTSDLGRWRTDGSTVCNEWRNLRHACSEIRTLGGVLYVKRANNGEVMMLVPQ